MSFTNFDCQCYASRCASVRVSLSRGWMESTRKSRKFRIGIVFGPTSGKRPTLISIGVFRKWKFDCRNPLKAKQKSNFKFGAFALATPANCQFDKKGFVLDQFFFAWRIEDIHFCLREVWYWTTENNTNWICLHVIWNSCKKVNKTIVIYPKGCNLCDLILVSASEINGRHKFDAIENILCNLHDRN